MHVLVVHNRYASAQPSGENKVVDQEVALLREGGHRVEVFERRSDDIAARSLPGKATVPLLVPWNPAVRRELTARLRADRPDVVHVHNVFPLLSPAVLAACADAGVPAVATLHNYTQVCPPGTLQRDGRPCAECVGSTPLPAVRHGCYRGSRLATVPLAVSLSVNRRRWWSGVRRFLCISAAQRDVLVRSGMPSERLAVKHNFVPDPQARRTGAGEHLLYLGRLAEPKGVRLLMA
ncbi:MAG: glycosyltransferase, partial [Streptomyces sp.]|nr:glycosyltransferase [Streptomyces sp.]